MIKNNLGVGALSKTNNQITKNQSIQTATKNIEKTNFLIIDVRGPKGFGKAVALQGKRSISNGYYYYDIMSLKDGAVYRNVMAGDSIEVIEARAGLSKIGFIGQMCKVVFNASGTVDKGKVFLTPFDDSGMKIAAIQRVENRFAESVKPTLFGLKAITESAIDELKAIYSRDD